MDYTNILIYFYLYFTSTYPLLYFYLSSTCTRLIHKPCPLPDLYMSLLLFSDSFCSIKRTAKNIVRSKIL